MTLHLSNISVGTNAQHIGDFALVEQILKGQDVSRAYRILVDRHKDFAFTIALRVLNNREEAEEVAQDAFVRAFKALHTFQRESKFTTWFYRIVLNAALSQKEKKKIVTDELDTARAIHTDLSTDNYKKTEQKYFIQRALEQLSPDDVSMITLFYLRELSLEEMAQATGIETNTIKVKMHRARKRMAEVLQEIMQGEERNLF